MDKSLGIGMQQVKKYVRVITGDSQIFRLEHRIFNISSFFITTFAIVGAIANYLIGLPLATVWLSLAGAVISAGLYFASRIRKVFSVSLIFCYVFASLGLLSVMHFYNGGIDGNLFYLIIMLLNIFLLMVPPRYQYWVFGIMYTDLLLLLVLEFYNPGWVLPYDSKEERMIDYGVTMLYSMFYTTIVIVTFRKSYYLERQKVVEQNNQLLALNEQILSQQKRLEEKTHELEASVKVANERNEHINILLRELNHRVKNNLQVVSSLLNLQAYAISDDNARRALLEGKNRLLSMILIHQRLYQNDNATEIYMPDYIKDLTETIMFTYSNEFDEDMLEYDVEPIWMNVEAAIPVGLICNELITNAFKYAYADVDEPLLHIKLAAAEDKFLLQISDNGPGMQNDGKKKTFGLDLISSLLKQLDGDMEVDTDSGTKVTVQFSKVLKPVLLE
ncbi:sensor histidine kinase [Pontibacter cellulosilyticus]|uniref:histidine kinase n=1 Tax=Pontibacter cellulosilyticus TaxID=1720253 RepID=A0A923N864_9BACT|nr:sensor histidine kinase [Pontibacter cellulosilyticus]MBC5994543.1 sensor histidine kinase [Pontibacter cellulosilyticus]